jgi:hypothetical protein
MGADRLASIGIPEAMQSAEAFRKTPLAFLSTVERFVGMESYEKRLLEKAQQQTTSAILDFANRSGMSETDTALLIARSGSTDPEKALKIADMLEESRLPQQKPAKPPEIFQMVDEYNRRKEDGDLSPWEEETFLKAIAKSSEARGMIVRQTEDGLEVIMGAGLGELTPATRTSTQKEVYGAAGTMADIGSLEKHWEDDFFTVPNKAVNWARNVAAKAFGISEEASGELFAQSTFTGILRGVINKYIHEFGGANLTPLEKQMIFEQIPNPEDSAPRARGKLKALKAGLARVMARGVLIRKHPELSGANVFNLANIDQYIMQKAESYYQEEMENNPDMSDEERKKVALEVDGRIAEEFGIRLNWLGLGE